jgi:hypothetical protein
MAETDLPKQGRTSSSTRPGAGRGGSVALKILIGVVSLFAITGAAAAALKDQVDTPPKVIVFIVLLTIGLGGFATILPFTASVSLGKWGKATGGAAVIAIFFIIILKAFGFPVPVPWPKELEEIHWRKPIVRPVPMIPYAQWVSAEGYCLERDQDGRITCPSARSR